MLKQLLLLLLLTMSAKAATITVAWDANSETNIAGYRLYYGTSSRVYPTVLDVGKTTMASISNLVSSGQYYIVATAYTTSGLESDYSSELTALTLIPFVSGFLPTNSTASSVTLTWNAPATNIVRYYIVHGTNTSVLGTNSTTGRTITISNLLMGKSYNFFITASNSLGIVSGPTLTIASTDTQPQPPTGIRIITILQGSSVLGGSWTNIAQYQSTVPADKAMAAYRTSMMIEPITVLEANRIVTSTPPLPPSFPRIR